MVEKNSELAPEYRKYKFRVVFRGNMVKDQNWEAAVLQELGSSPATMEGGKAIDCCGCFPGHEAEQADAENAYNQAELRGTETWITLPEHQIPAKFKHMKRPAFRLKRALYGHPDSGKFWENHCDEHLQIVGFSPIPNWPSC